MREERLLERLSSLEREPLRREGLDRARLIDSVVRHLSLILNTRQGSVPAAAGFGMPDFQEFLQGYPQSVRELETEIRRTIERYEPRLQSVQVAFLPQNDDPLKLHFQISASLKGVEGRDSTRVCMETVVGAAGRFSVKL
ncbi:hypothetical protein GMLC_31060 [Geomonas limicola]|uniref:IraD/Gp25-like domain-containing protein n=1 Tax=Geomonas limicola TaxID=2740186 RepID=A0A6V8NCK1_9BACT|nr:type VI secretion system baseplate subunit TssE [Geomonas limicola]GFO69527.1 hypothetical protein GMLC_31060 [Geomonas limicola]